MSCFGTDVIVQSGLYIVFRELSLQRGTDVISPLYYYLHDNISGIDIIIIIIISIIIYAHVCRNLLRLSLLHINMK